MTEYKLQSDWMDKAKEYNNYSDGRDYKRMRRLSRKDEKLLLRILLMSDYNGCKDNKEIYVYRG